jgi:hypothetical protein
MMGATGEVTVARPRRRRRSLAIGAALTVCAIAVGAIVASGGGDDGGEIAPASDVPAAPAANAPSAPTSAPTASAASAPIDAAVPVQIPIDAATVAMPVDAALPVQIPIDAAQIAIPTDARPPASTAPQPPPRGIRRDKEGSTRHGTDTKPSTSKIERVDRGD